MKSASLLDMIESGEDTLLSVRYVAKALRVDPTTIRRWIKQGILPAISFPEKRTARQRQIHRIRKTTLKAIVEQRKQQSEQEHMDVKWR